MISLSHVAAMCFVPTLPSPLPSYGIPLPSATPRVVVERYVDVPVQKIVRQVLKPPARTNSAIAYATLTKAPLSAYAHAITCPRHSHYAPRSMVLTSAMLLHVGGRAFWY
eukprot:2054025-Rhodomonas_salina.2